jgi:hypothetical protein
MKFNFRIVKLPKISGRRTTFYTAYLPDEETTLFDQFLENTKTSHLEELKNILAEIQTMSDKTGAREDLFKKYEGIKIGEGVYAFFSKQLRLYCFRMDNCLILLGGGGWKTVAKWQDDPALAKEVNRIRFVAKEIDKRIRNREIKRSNNDMELIGDLIFDFDDDLD